MAGNFGNPYLDQKYDAIRLQGDVARQQAVRAGLENDFIRSHPAFNPVANETASMAALRQAQAGEATGAGALYGAQAGQAHENLFGPSMTAGAQTGLIGAQTIGQNILNTPSYPIPTFAAGTPDIPRFNLGTSENYKKGKGKVPGKGDGTKDTQPAMLAPGEAVLNKGAAEHLGRHNIDLLNAIGLSKMGMPGVADNQGQQPGMAAGNQEPSSNVPGYADGDALIQRIPTNPGKPPGPPAPQTPGYAGGTSTITPLDTTDRRNLMPGNPNAGFWGNQGQVGQSGNTALRESLGLGVTRQIPAAPSSAPKPPGYKKGTSDVKGTDTEDNRAKTANKEAKGATGADTEDDRAKTYNYKKGTSKVPPRAGKATPAKPAAKAKEPTLPPGHLAVHPAVLHALLNMPHGGMPAPGSAMPMPMPMPPAAGVGQTPFQLGGNATMLPRQGGGQ